jgi:outer membrane receptor protein involved in Fe transport
LFGISGFNSIGPRGFWPNFNDLNNFMLSDSLSIIKGNHTIKFGGEVRRTQIFREAQRHRRGNLTFSGNFTSALPNSGPSRANTGNGLADMLLGWVTGGNTGSPQGETIVVPYYGFFIQDDWKITPKLTMNIGMRYEMIQNPIFPDPANQTVARYLLPMINNISPDQEGFVFPRNGRDCGCEQDRNNFAPRLGLAYRINDKTVIRVRRRDLLRRAG